ncbi:MAG: hypothetical protein IJH67_11910 [Thermoguttaceae bacterium]|nr:hypothetical protein [Thermoguttaceae bacterium]
MKRTLYTTIALALLVWLGSTGLAQEAEQKPDQAAETAQPAQPKAPEEASLEEKQRIVHDQWKRLEEILLRMSETTALTDPDRAELIKKVIAQGKQKMIDPQFQTLTDLLKDGEISRALDNQKDLRADLNDLLKVLETENRMRRVKSEKERIKGYIKDLEKLIAGQRNLQNQTMNSDDVQKLSGQQTKLSEMAESLKQKIDADEKAGQPQDSQNSENQDGENKEGENQDGENQDGQKQDGEKQDGQKQDGQQQDGQNQDSQNQNGQQQDGQQQDGQQQDGQQQDGQQQNGQQQNSDSQKEETPQDRLKKAQQKMEEAQKKLEQAQKEGAVEKQEEALRELEKAKSELEEILRQLREEEEKRKLAQLEVRFKKMLELQKSIYDSTLRLDEKLKKNDGNDADGTLSVESVRLSGRENDVYMEGNKALLLLQEDGTAVAMTEALASAVEDIQGVIELFNKANVGVSNQTRQENILATLEELLEAIKREMKDMEDKEQQSQNGESPAGEMMEALVDQLAELKMIRSMQMRINKTTQRCQKLITGAAAEDPEVINVLNELSVREERLRQILHDISIGKNK